MAVDSIDCCRMRGPSRLAELVDSNPVGKLILWRCRQKRLPPKKRYHDCHSHQHHHSVVGKVDLCWLFLNGSREKKDGNSGEKKDKEKMKTRWKDLKMGEDDGGSGQMEWLDVGMRWLYPLGKVVG